MTLTEDSLALEAETQSPNLIVLSEEDLERAVAQTETLRPAEGWQAHLNAIAWVGFQQWLSERGIAVENPACSVTRPEVAGLLSAVCSLEVNGFRLCLIPAGSLDDEAVTIPRAALELAAFVPQLLVLVDVREEVGQVDVQGCLRYDQMRAHIAALPEELTAHRDWTYTIPRTWFDLDPDALLLYLRCLPPEALASGSVASGSVAIAPPTLPSVAQVQETLSTLAGRLQSQVPIWKLLTWEQAAVVLTQPELGRSLLPSPSPGPVAQAVVNVRQWFQDSVQIPQDQDWRLLPPLSRLQEATSMRYARSPVEQFEDIVTTISQSGTPIPSQARAAYRDLTWETVSVRLYAITWDLSTASDQAWCLLLLLGPQPNRELPAGITLRISDDIQVLDQQTLSETGPDAYLFSQVVGEWREQFQVTVNLTNGAEITLPPFTYIRHD